LLKFDKVVQFLTEKGARSGGQIKQPPAAEQN
jgi:hypothetical protein